MEGQKVSSDDFASKMINDFKIIGVNAIYKTISEYEKSEWVCYMFGSSSGVNNFVWRPAKGEQPNWFWRKMQYLLLGHRWVKESE